MATPIVHASAGLVIASIYLLSARESESLTLYRLAFIAITLACLSDIDLIYSYLLAGNVVDLHFGITHTVAFAAFVAFSLWVLSWAATRARVLLVFFLVLSHVAIDGFTGPARGYSAAVGIKAFSPFYDGALVSKFTLFKGVNHGEWFGRVNMVTVLWDMLYVPFACCFIYFSHVKVRKKDKIH